MQPVAMSQPDLAQAPLTEDRFFAGALSLLQPARGHRIGSDAVLLAAAAPRGAASLCDLGCGAGAVGLRVAQVFPQARVTLCDISAETVALAQRNIALNQLEGRCTARMLDIFAAPDTDLRGSMQCVLTNPPFFESGTSRAPPDAGKARAHVLTGTLAGWIKGAAALLAAKGEIVAIHRADRLPALLAALERQFGDIRLRFIQPRADAPAHRVLVKARLASRAPLVVLPALVLHQPSGAFTPEAEALHRGETGLDWGES